MKKKKRTSIKVRRNWKIKPVTKLKESVKLYRREAALRAMRKEVMDEL